MLTFDPEVAITAGENSGLTLAQDFALVSLITSAAQFKNNQFICEAQFAKLDAATVSNSKNAKQAIGGWVATQGHKPIQVTGGWLTP